jgi:hypothetical protein
MNISQPINSSVISKNNFSHNSQYLLVPKGKNLILYSLNPSIQKLNKFIFFANINSVIFSPNSEYFLVLLIKIQECHIKSVKNYDFTIKIKEQIFGIKSAIWSSNEDYILLSLGSYNSIHIFSTKDEFENIEEELDNMIIKDNSNNNNNNKNFKGIISNIKYQNLSKGISFSYNGGEFIAIAIRKQIKDYIEIYDTENYNLVSIIPCNTTDLDDISWSKDNSFILVWDNNIYDCKLYIYSLAGNLITINEPYKNYPGITKFNISPNGHYITLGYYDNSIKLIHYLSFKICKELNPTDLLLPDIFNKKSDFIFSKTVILVEDTAKDDINFNHLYDKEKYMFSIEKTFPKKKSNINNSNELYYINNMDYSFNSQYLAFTSTKYQHLILIYDINAFKLSYLLVFQSNVISFAWSPNSIQLVICTEMENKIYFFIPQRVKAFKLPIIDNGNTKDNNSINISNSSYNNNKENKNEKIVLYSLDGKRILFKTSKFTFFLIEPGNEI